MEYENIFEPHTETLKSVLHNIEIILSRKDEIVQASSMWNHSIDIGLNCTMLLSNGLCHNADLWSLENINIEHDNDSTISLMDYLATTFIDLNQDRYITRPHVIWPVINLANTRMWQNPMRWEYTEFCQVELQHILNTGELRSEV